MLNSRNIDVEITYDRTSFEWVCKLTHDAIIQGVVVKKGTTVATRIEKENLISFCLQVNLTIVYAERDWT